MFNLRTRTARQILNTAGRWPSAAVTFAAANLFLTPTIAYAQPATPAAPAAQTPPSTQPKTKSDAKVAVSEHMTVDLHVKDEDLANVLELLSIQTQKNIIASKNVSGKVTATLYGVTFYQALDAILHVNGFGYIENGNFIYVYTNDELKQIEAALKKRVSKVIRLNYLNAKDAKEFVSPLLSKDGGEIKVNDATKDFTINEKLPIGKDDYALAAALVVIDFEENIAAIEELVRQLDTRPAQVLVEATILQTALTESNAFGVDFSIIGDLNFGDFINIGGPLGAANGLIRGGSGASGQGFSPSGDRGNAVTSSPGNTAGPGTFKVGVLAGDLAIFLRMLDQVTDSVVLSNPKILTLNRQPSRVLVGKRVGYLNTTSTETSTTQTVNFLDTGTQLYFRPFVSSEGEVRMELKPQVSSAEIRNVTDANNAVVTIPDEVTQEIVTNVNVRDGQTVVLGGLFTESTTFTRRQVPWLGDIPVLGAAFKGHDDAVVRSEIIFLITPTIINDSQLNAQAERYAGDIERLRTGTRQKLLPWSQDRMTDKLNVEAEQLAASGNYEQAMWNLSRSLSMNSNQPQAYRLRERITGERERWSDRSLLNELVDAEINNRNMNVTPRGMGPDGQPPVQHRTPWGSTDTVREPVPQKVFNTTPGTNNQIGTPATQDFTPVANVDEPLSLNDSTNPSSTFQQPMGNVTSNDSFAQASVQSDNVYRASMMPASESSANAFVDSSFSVSAQTASTQSNTDTQTWTIAPAPEAVASSNTSASTFTAPTDNTNFNNTFSNSNEHNTIASNSAMTAPDASFNNAFSATPAPTHSNVDPNFVATNTNSVNNTNNTNLTPNTPVDPAKSLASVKQTLTTLRGQIELFSLMNNGSMPQIGSSADNAWQPLLDAKLIENVPTNSLVGTENASKVMIADAPDTKLHNNYGWVYNPKTGQLWAAGFDSLDKPLNSSTAALQPQPSTSEMVNAISAPKPAAKPATNPVSSTPSTAGVDEHKQ